uniref:Golgi reassembly-stacking protein 2-like n=1 Tax=Dermatophagoides pteronyssinus TaxID=6956 RepID=A0A6P6Y4U7_DERPT|nr:Golgi reassembly-stacking protein 2-like [Dermatophagoides pteronyssinus]
MGGSQSTEIPGGGTEGYHVLKVQDDSPGSKAGLEPYFDYIIVAGNTRLNQMNDDLKDILKSHVDKSLRLLVYNSKYQNVRQVDIVPTNNWNGQGLLGVSIRFASFENANENVWHVLDVAPNSPADIAGLKSHRDYIIGADSLLQDNDDIFNLIQTYEGKPLKLFVYNVDTDSCREVTIVPNSNWGGSGLLGCDIGYGYLHRIPQPKSDDQESSSLLSNVTSGATIIASNVPSKPTIMGDTGGQIEQRKPPSDMNQLWTKPLTEISKQEPLPVSTSSMPLSSSTTDVKDEQKRQLPHLGPTVVTPASTIPSSSLTTMDKPITSASTINSTAAPLLSKNLYQHHTVNPATSYFTPAPSYNNSFNPVSSSSVIPPYSTSSSSSSSFVNTGLSQQFGQSLSSNSPAPPPSIPSSTMMSTALIQPPFVSSYSSSTFSSSSMPFASAGQIQPPPMFTMPSPSVMTPHSSSSASTTSFQPYKPTFPGGATYPPSLPPLTSSSGGHYGSPPPLVMPPPISNSNITLFNPTTSNTLSTPSAPPMTSAAIESTSATPMMMMSTPPSQ